MSDTAEYWFDIKNRHVYTGPDYYHIPDFDCGHKHWFEAKFIDEVNCNSCKKALQDGLEHNLKSVEDHKRHDANKLLQRANNIKNKWKQKYPNNPDCPSCGFVMIEKVNKSNGNKFWGCCQFPNCKKTLNL